MVKCSSKMA